MVKNIIFDFGGVIVHLDPSEAVRRFESLGISDASRQLDIFGQTGIFGAVETGEISAHEFCRQLALQAKEKSGRFANNPHPCFSFEQAQWAWMGYIKEVPQKNLDSLLRLRQSYKLYILSNLNPFIQSWAESTDFSGDGHPLGYYLDGIYYSFQLHDYKPAPSIYEKMMAQAGLKPNECLFLDDSIRNVSGCEAAGMHGLLVEKDEDWTTKLDLELLRLS